MKCFDIQMRAYARLFNQPEQVQGAKTRHYTFYKKLETGYCRHTLRVYEPFLSIGHIPVRKG